jgi:cysteine synthase
MPSDACLQSVSELTGATPLIELSSLEMSRPRARVFAKCEQHNLTGSFKDRLAPKLLARALAAGAKSVIVPSSGNLAIALAVLCKKARLRCVAVMPATVALERRQLCALYGAEVVLSEPEAQLIGAVERAKAIASETADAMVLSSFEGFAPSEAYGPLAGEIILALGNQPIDAFVVALGSGALAAGAGSAIKAAHRHARVIGVEAESSAVFSGGARGPTKMHDLAAGFVAPGFDPKILDQVRTISDARAWEMKRSLAQEAGLLVGHSAGAAVAVALDVARELSPGAAVVTVLGDTGERYFSMDRFFTEAASA